MDLTEKVHELKRLKHAVADMEKSITAIEDVIKAEMSAQDITEMIVDVFKIHWKPYTTTRIDTIALKAELPDIAARYTKTKESRRFTIT